MSGQQSGGKQGGQGMAPYGYGNQSGQYGGQNPYQQGSFFSTGGGLTRPGLSQPAPYQQPGYSGGFAPMLPLPSTPYQQPGMGYSGNPFGSGQPTGAQIMGGGNPYQWAGGVGDMYSGGGAHTQSPGMTGISGQGYATGSPVGPSSPGSGVLPPTQMPNGYGYAPQNTAVPMQQSAGTPQSGGLTPAQIAALNAQVSQDQRNMGMGYNANGVFSF